MLKNLGDYVKIYTGKLDANAKTPKGQYPFFTCAIEASRIDTFSYDCECVLVAGNGDLNVKYYAGKFDAYQRTYIIESLDKNVLNVKYLYYFMDRYVNELRQLSIGGVIKYIRLAYLTNAKIPLPPLEHQRFIADVLDRADALRTTRQKSIEKLDKLLESIFLEMFGDPATNPKNWNLMSIRDLVKHVNYGSSKKAKMTGIYPILRMGNITYNGEFDFTDLKYIDLSEKEESKHLVYKNQILFNRTNSKELVGKTAVYREEKPMAFAGYLIRLVPNALADAEYISAFLNTKYMKQVLKEKCKNIIGMANINAQELQNFTIPLPPINKQHIFAHIVAKITNRKKILRFNLLKFNDLFLSLQQRAFCGELLPFALDEIAEFEEAAPLRSKI